MTALLPKQPASMFYWADWLRDTALRSCSVAARGLWIDLLALMHDGRPYGHLSDRKGRGLTDDQVARMVGLTLGEYQGLLEELESAGIPSRTAGNLLFSRRMVRDEVVRYERAESGRRGGLATQAKIKGTAQPSAKARALALLETATVPETEGELLEGGLGGTNAPPGRKPTKRQQDRAAVRQWAGEP